MGGSVVEATPGPPSPLTGQRPRSQTRAANERGSVSPMTAGFLFWILLHGAGEDPPADEAALRRAMAARPVEAIALVRRAADRLPSATVRTLLAEAARMQEERLTLLNDEQAAEL